MLIHNGEGMRRQRLHTEVRREQIAQAALDLVSGAGMGALSVGAVARRVGIAPSALYRHYPSKEAMLDATLELIRTRIESNVRAAREATADPLEAIGRLLELQVRLVRENRGIPHIMFSEDLYFRRPDRKRRLYAIVAGYAGRVAEMVRAGQRAGSIRADLDPETAGVMFFGLFQPGAVFWHLSDGGFDITRHTRRAWSIFSASIRAPAAPPPRPRRAPARPGRRAK
jgi:AcrR family transcriptional regulator